jgi:hypothetical protein
MKTVTIPDEDLEVESENILIPDFAKAAQDIIEETEADDQLPSIEKAARLAGAYLLLGVASGKFEGKPEYDFLKNLFEKKTPAPVQRIEQRTHADFRVLFTGALQANPNILDESLARAVVAHQAIQERLTLPPSLELPPKVADEAEFEEKGIGEEVPKVETPVDWKPGQEPAEITSIRKEGEDESLSDRHRRFIEMLRGG